MIKTSNVEKYQIYENSSNSHEQKKEKNQTQTKWHRKSSQNEINKTMETPKLTPHPHQKSWSHPSRYPKHIKYDIHLSFRKKITQKYTNSIPVKSNHKFHNSQTLQ